MTDEHSSATPAYSPAFPVAAALLAAGIFAVDTFTPLTDAVASLYVVVVLLAGSFLRSREVLLVSVASAVLAITSYLLQHDLTYPGDALVRLLVSLTAIGTVSFLVVKNRTAAAVAEDRARLLDLSHDTIFVRDMNDRITYWNRGAEKSYGWSQAEVLGKITHKMMQTVFPQPLESINAELLRTGRWEGELRHTKRDGISLVVASRWSLQLDDRGSPAAILETNNDITDRRHAEDELSNAQTELLHVTRITTLGELTASIAHEVNQPLAAIVTNGEVSLRLLERETPDLAEVRDAVGAMIGDGRRASEIIQRLRALSKKSEAERAALAINTVIEEVIPLVQGQVAGHRASLRLELAPAPVVLGDRVQLQQVIINLIVNAVEAMESVSDRPRDVLVRSRPDGAEVLVAVEDSGGGIDPDDTKRLFNAFYSTKPGGMGMGLSICRSIIESHGGRLWASSNEGPGATFQFTLPLHQENTR